MPALVFVLLFKMVFEAVRVFQQHAKLPVLLCADCFSAHVQYTANARCEISCTYGGAMRPMKLDVLYCTDYRARHLPLRAGVIGFCAPDCAGRLRVDGALATGWWIVVDSVSAASRSGLELDGFGR